MHGALSARSFKSNAYYQHPMETALCSELVPQPHCTTQCLMNVVNEQKRLALARTLNDRIPQFVFMAK